MTDYKEQRNDPRYKSFQARIIEMDKGCVLKDKHIPCGGYLTVHHCFYIPDRNLWDYDDKDVVSVCSSHHDLLYRTKSHVLGKWLNENFFLCGRDIIKVDLLIHRLVKAVLDYS